MSSNKRDARLRNHQLVQLQTETDEIHEKSVIALEEIKALEQELSKLKEQRKEVQSSTPQEKWKNSKVLNCKDCKQKCNTTTRKPVAIECRDTMCLLCFWQNYIATRDNSLRLMPRPYNVEVVCPHCLLVTSMPYNLNEQDVPKSHTTLQVLEICESG